MTNIVKFNKKGGHFMLEYRSRSEVGLRGVTSGTRRSYVWYIGKISHHGFDFGTSIGDENMDIGGNGKLKIIGVDLYDR